MADNQTKQVFQAIDGSELRQIILTEIARKIDSDPRFRRHLTYPLLSFAWNVVVAAYPMEPPEFKLSGKVPYKRAVLPEDGEPEVIALKGELNIDAPQEGGLAPDEARERAGLSIPSRQSIQIAKGPSVTVDTASSGPLPDLPPFDSSATQVEPEKIDPRDLVYDPVVVASGQATPSTMKQATARRPVQGSGVPMNRAGASPNMARSVDLTTRAAPDGEGNVRVDKNIMGEG